mmetsp:Transcript_19796/g.36507  ORF Transcript_19796/g.36507 Transcript_19796/m.36507 type:complete len:460 (+) Transcript_19796:9614-10993(+)
MLSLIIMELRASSTNYKRASSKYNNVYLLKNCFAAGFSLFYIGVEISSILYMESQMFIRQNPALARFVYIATMMSCLTLGSMTVRPLSKKLGRRHLLMAGLVCILTGNLIIIIDSPISFFIAKIVACYGGGICSATAPIYIKEMSPVAIGLRTGGVMPFSFVLGLAIAVSFATLDTTHFDGILWWQIQYIVISCICFIHLLIIMFLIPDTPHWYYENSDQIQGDNVVRSWFKDTEDVIMNKAYVKDEAQTKMQSGRLLVVSSFVSFIMATCGINYSFFFDDNYISKAIHLEKAREKLMLMMGGVFVIIVCSIFSNRIRRKLAIVVGLVSMGLFQIIAGALIQYNINNLADGFILFMILASFEIGIGTFYWIYLPELLKVRRISLGISVYWGIEVVMSGIYYLKHYYFTTSIVYYAHGVLNVILAAILHFIGIETLGRGWRAIEEISDDHSSEEDIYESY